MRGQCVRCIGGLLCVVEYSVGLYDCSVASTSVSMRCGVSCRRVCVFGMSVCAVMVWFSHICRAVCTVVCCTVIFLFSHFSLASHLFSPPPPMLQLCCHVLSAVLAAAAAGCVSLCVVLFTNVGWTSMAVL